MLKIFNKHEGLVNATADVSRLLADEKFTDLVRELDHFDMADVAPIDVLVFVQHFCKFNEVTVGTYTPFYWRSKARARFVPSRPYGVELSTRRLHRSSDPKLNNASLVGSIVHELVHAADNDCRFSFGHGNNKPQGKENTAPYKLGKLAKEYVLENY